MALEFLPQRVVTSDRQSHSRFSFLTFSVWGMRLFGCVASFVVRVQFRRLARSTFRVKAQCSYKSARTDCFPSS